MTTASRKGDFSLGNLKINIHPSREAAGAAAAQSVAAALKELSASRESIGVIFATGASQLETLRALVKIEELPWGKVSGFHMDDYIDLPKDHPASFLKYLQENLTQQVKMKEFLAIDGNAPDIEQTCNRYARALRSADPQLCLLGIGENGHLAFNDPAEADFNDPADIKIVQLDQPCREQQAAEGWFNSVADVPKRAITLTIPTLFRVPKIIVSISGKRKAHIVRRSLLDPISTACPSTILRTHLDTTLYLDEEAAAEIGDVLTSSQS
ncbi:MAG TPA: glucosamine-6-phosphate deaminase [Terracidiphilus sp.]|jgi:glucosamine-6-phosphate deaminase